MADGIDVSRWQGRVHWPSVRKAEKTFVYVKATEGVGFVSSTLDDQVAGARAAGLVVGCYHYARPENDPAAEARHFAKQLKRLNVWQNAHLPPCLDIEESAADAPAWVRTFIRTLRSELGRPDVMVYASSSYFAGPLRGEDWADDQVSLWVAHYGREPGHPSYRTSRVVMHQYSSSGRVSGVNGPVDLNLCMVNLSALTKGSTRPPTPRPSPRPSPAPPSYTVRRGDTLSEIGARLDIDWHDIARINNIRDPYVIHPGQVLRLPDSRTRRTHRVQQGETLSAIGQRYGVNWRDIARVNKLPDPDRIYPGQVLTIP